MTVNHYGDETSSDPPTVIYKFRNSSRAYCNAMDIGYETIRTIEPFKHTSEGKQASFQILVIRGSANSLKNPIYTPFRNFLLNKCTANDSRVKYVPNYWIFVVTDHPKLLAEDIYRTRMNDKFWGLNERTAYRKARG